MVYKVKYIVHRRFKEKAICGNVNLPAFTECQYKNGIIMINNQPLCLATSENAHQYFAINNDGRGMERGSLTQSIQKILSKRDANHQTRWNKVWEDTLCQKYKRTEYSDYWLWNHHFFNANIEDLRYIIELIGTK